MDIRIALRRNVPYGSKRKKSGNKKEKQEKEKKEKGKERKRSVMFACLEDEGTGPKMEEIQENGANVAYRHINLENALGGNDWERKNWATECSTIIDTGFNGGGMCSFSWMNRYVE